MEKNKILFTSESVSEGHPDKICDQISDSILDACLSLDENVHVACETFAVGNTIIVGGEIFPKLDIDIQKIVKDVLKRVGYDKKELGCDYHTVKIYNLIQSQSENIFQGVSQTKAEDLGAGDQGMMFGYATNETHGYMPLPISIAHKLVREATSLRKSGKFKGARPDMKSQVTIDYTDPKHIRIDTIIMSISHDKGMFNDEFRRFVKEEIMFKVAKSFHLNTDFNIYINPTGEFEICGPAGDSGLTGRKIIVDTYGGSAHHGGGAFSGKDPSKVDRSAAYMARYIAKNLVASGVADRLEIQLSYAIGVNTPISIFVETFGTEHYSKDVILNIINKVFDMRPGIIIQKFRLTKPLFKYSDVSNYGHFGRPDLNLPWECLDKVEEIKNLLKK